jgi:Uma2 family endonuclease
MSTLPKHKYTPKEYLDLERASEHKSEFLNGEIFAMGGASARHALIVVNTSAELRNLLRDRACTVYSTDLRVRASYEGLYSYPDVIVVCGEPSFIDDTFDTLTNPLLIVEVLSPTTKNYDRGEKFEQYRKIEDLKEYLLVGQDQPHVEHYFKQPDGTWLFSEVERRDSTVHLPSLDCRLSLAEVYAKVDFG